MPLLDVAPLVDAVDVIRFVGPRPFAKGRQYSREDRVRDITYDPVDQVATGTVRGSSAEPYRCEIVLQPTRGEQSRPSRSTCTCPLGGDCKHVAAVLLANNASALTPPTAAPLDGDGDRPSPRAGGGAAGDAAPSPDDWRARLGGLTGRPASRGARTTSMGLLFELRPRVAPPRSARRDAPRVDRHERSTGGLGGGLVSGSSLAGVDQTMFPCLSCRPQLPLPTPTSRCRKLAIGGTRIGPVPA